MAVFWKFWIEFWLNQGANVNEVFTSGKLAGFNPLLIAIIASVGPLALVPANPFCLPIIQLMLDYGANVNQVCEMNGLTIFQMCLFFGDIGIVNLLLEYGANVEDGQLDLLLGYPAVPNAMVDLINAQKRTRSSALKGAKHLYLEIEGGTLQASLAQWIPVLPLEARSEFSAWVSSSISDSSACYAAFFRPITTFTSSTATCLLRNQIGHDGISHIRRLVISYLVFPNPKTRKIIHECNAFGGEEVATPMQVAEAASRVAEVRAAWPK